MFDPLIKKYDSVDDAVYKIGVLYNVWIYPEDFTKNRKQKSIILHVAAIGYENIIVENPAYKVYWWEPPYDFAKQILRMVKSKCARETIWKEIRRVFANIDNMEYVDAFEKQCNEPNTL